MTTHALPVASSRPCPLTSEAHPPRVAVLVPCYNEARTVAKVVRDFREALPDATIFVYDNNSTDDTVTEAKRVGAIVRHEPLQGKGHVVRRMFGDIDADIYVLVDGDATYDANAAPVAIEKLLMENLDIVNVAREVAESGAYRPGHLFGNRLLTGVVAAVFGNRFQDMLSGFKVFSRRFVKSFPALSRGFEIETELTIHALELRMPVAEIYAPYRMRPAGSKSKLRTIHDGFRILWTIILMIKEEKPAPLFLSAAAAMSTVSFALAIPILSTYLRTGLVPRLPTAILCTGLIILAMLSATSGIILDSVARSRKEGRRLWYLSLPASRAASVEAGKAER